jgi:hypothetical protein
LYLLLPFVFIKLHAQLELSEDCCAGHPSQSMQAYAMRNACFKGSLDASRGRNGGGLLRAVPRTLSAGCLQSAISACAIIPYNYATFYDFITNGSLCSHNAGFQPHRCSPAGFQGPQPGQCAMHCSQTSYEGMSTGGRTAGIGLPGLPQRLVRVRPGYSLHLLVRQSVMQKCWF